MSFMKVSLQPEVYPEPTRIPSETTSQISISPGRGNRSFFPSRYFLIWCSGRDGGDWCGTSFAKISHNPPSGDWLIYHHFNPISLLLPHLFITLFLSTKICRYFLLFSSPVISATYTLPLYYLFASSRSTMFEMISNCSYLCLYLLSMMKPPNWNRYRIEFMVVLFTSHFLRIYASVVVSAGKLLHQFSFPAIRMVSTSPGLQHVITSAANHVTNPPTNPTSNQNIHTIQMSLQQFLR